MKERKASKNTPPGFYWVERLLTGEQGVAQKKENKNLCFPWIVLGDNAPYANNEIKIISHINFPGANKTKAAKPSELNTYDMCELLAEQEQRRQKKLHPGSSIKVETKLTVKHIVTIDE